MFFSKSHLQTKMAFMHVTQFKLLTVAFFILSVQFAEGKDMREDRPWFKNKNFTTLNIKKYKSVSEHKIVAELAIVDVKAVKKIVERIEKIPTDGDRMVSFGPQAQHTQLIFTGEDSKSTIEIYQKGFKTPSTGFNSDGNIAEKTLEEDIMGLLTPALNTKLLKIENLDLKFKDFSVTYKGSETTTAPVTASFSTETYIVKDKVGKEQKVQITSGQTGPKPQKFEVNQKTYSLLPLKSSKGEDLLPDYFEITQ
jgi:hypothetical protein